LTHDTPDSTGHNRRKDRAARRRKGLRATVYGLGLLLLFVGAGFIAFVRNLPSADAATALRADGIVVLTGAAARINDALALLASGHGERLLISGVNPKTRPQELAKLAPEYAAWFECCVDLDHSALNTIGNAIETRRWVRAQKFRSLIVVTSDFHMPRSLAEIRYQLPDVVLMPYAVVSDRVHVDDWWTSPASARLLFAEYLKYIAAVARTWLAATLARDLRNIGSAS